MIDQAGHAAAFGSTARDFMQAAVEFAGHMRQTFSVEDVAKLYMLAGAWLLAGAFDRMAAAAMLRELADGIEHQRDAPPVN